VPLLIAGVVIVGDADLAHAARSILLREDAAHEVPLADLVARLEAEAHAPVRVAGTAVFLTSDPDFAPTALLHNLKHNKVLHEHNVILTVKTADVPRVIPPPSGSRSRRSPSRFAPRDHAFRLHAEQPNVPTALALMPASSAGTSFDIMSTSFYLGRRKLVPDAESGMPMWQDRLFIALANIATDPSDYFRLPTNRVVELGSHVVI
jgi:KUP system potassium uptake protein